MKIMGLMTMTMIPQIGEQAKGKGGKDDYLFDDKGGGSSDAVATDSTNPDFMDLRRVVEEFIDITLDARLLSERCRDYYDGKQWTAQQIEDLKKRRQAPIVNNRIKVKLNGLLGLTSLRRADPQAFPRNYGADEESSEAMTEALRFVAQRTNFNDIMLEIADNYFCEGYGAAYITEETLADGTTDVCVDKIPWDRIFFDPFSRKSDYSDARDKGFVLWMDEPDIVDAFPDASPDALVVGAEVTASGDTYDDKPSWYIARGIRKRHLVSTHFFKRKGCWYMAIYTGSGYLMEPQESPYLDEFGKPTCPMEMVSAYTDRMGNRYGEIASYLDLQDEINHRRSKALFLLSQRQTYGNRGAVKDIKKAKRELAKADGHLEVGQGEYGKDFGILPTGDMAQGQLELLAEAKQEIDSMGFNAQLSGERQGDLSGVAIGKLQNSGSTELSISFDRFSAFRLRCYRQMWWRVRQYWDQKKWIRVTDDQEMPRWVGFNVQVLMGAYLQEIMDNTSKPYAMRLGASAQMVQLEQSNPQALQQPVMVKNAPAELDIDIILDESYDVVNASQEQLDAILKFGAQGQVDIIDLLEISNIIGKKKLIEKLEKRRTEQQQAAAQAPTTQLITAKAQDTAANAQLKGANAGFTQAKTIKTMEEAKLLNTQEAAGTAWKDQAII